MKMFDLFVRGLGLAMSPLHKWITIIQGVLNVQASLVGGKIKCYLNVSTVGQENLSVMQFPWLSFCEDLISTRLNRKVIPTEISTQKLTLLLGNTLCWKKPWLMKISFLGQFICGDKRCAESEGLRSWEASSNCSDCNFVSIMEPLCNTDPSWPLWRRGHLYIYVFFCRGGGGGVWQSHK